MSECKRHKTAQSELSELERVRQLNLGTPLLLRAELAARWHARPQTPSKQQLAAAYVISLGVIQQQREEIRRLEDLLRERAPAAETKRGLLN